MAKPKKKQKPNGQMPKFPEPHEVPGVSREVQRCARCGEAVRNAVLQGNDLVAPQIPVNAQPAEMIMPDGRVLALFRPHTPTCKNPLAIFGADGKARVIG